MDDLLFTGILAALAGIVYLIGFWRGQVCAREMFIKAMDDVEADIKNRARQ